MSDAYADQVKQQQQQEQTQGQPGRSHSLTITLHPNGQIDFSMPANKVLAHGLLGVASAKLAELQVLETLSKQTKESNGQGITGLLKKMGRG